MRLLRNILSCFRRRKQGDYPISIEPPLDQIEPPLDQIEPPLAQIEPPLPPHDETSPTPVEPPPYNIYIGTEQHQFEPPPPYRVDQPSSRIGPPPPQNETTLPQIQPPPYEIEPYPPQILPSSNTDEIASHHEEPTIYSEENMRQFREDQARLDRVREESRYREEVRRRANLRRAEILINAIRLAEERRAAYYANKSYNWDD